MDAQTHFQSDSDPALADHLNAAGPLDGQPGAHAMMVPAEAGREMVNGKPYLRDPKGALMPLSQVKPADLLTDEQVRKIMGHADELNAQIARFKRHTLDDVAALMTLLFQEYGVQLGGTKGNVTLSSYDATLQVRLQVQDRLTFGPELHAAKELTDQYLTELAQSVAGERVDELTAVVQHAFRTDKEGLVNRSELFRLLRLEIDNPVWQEAMRAIKDSIRIEGSKEHIRFYRRPDPRSKWVAVTIDVADA